LPASGREIRHCLLRTKAGQSMNSEQKSLVAIAMEKLARIFAEHPEVMELEINPLMISGDKALVADVKIALE
jgi:succinyl-CoA synthetase beta subunit